MPLANKERKVPLPPWDFKAYFRWKIESHFNHEFLPHFFALPYATSVYGGTSEFTLKTNI